jgi:hypothetical protein
MIEPVIDVLYAYKMLPKSFPAAELFVPGS